MPIIRGYRFPGGLLYHPDHAWVKIEREGIVRVGLNDFLQQAAGTLVYVEPPLAGALLEQGKECGWFESSKWVGRIIAPLSGAVLEVNRQLKDDTTLVNRDPYRRGWIFKMKPTRLEAEKTILLAPKGLEAWLTREMTMIEARRRESRMAGTTSTRNQ